MELHTACGEQTFLRAGSGAAPDYLLLVALGLLPLALPASPVLRLVRRAILHYTGAGTLVRTRACGMPPPFDSSAAGAPAMLCCQQARMSWHLHSKAATLFSSPVAQAAAVSSSRAAGAGALPGPSTRMPADLVLSLP